MFYINYEECKYKLPDENSTENTGFILTMRNVNFFSYSLFNSLT